MIIAKVGVIKNNRKVFAIIGLLFITGIGWVVTNSINTNNASSILSLKDNWENLEAVAHIWQPDAYLTNVTVNVARQKHLQ